MATDSHNTKLFTADNAGKYSLYKLPDSLCINPQVSNSLHVTLYRLFEHSSCLE